MSSLRALLVRLLGAFRRRRSDERLNDEIDAHLALLTDEYRSRGLSAEDAARAARRAFGGVTQTREAYRDVQGGTLFAQLAQDLRYGARLAFRNIGFTATACLALAVGISANAVLFSVANALFFQPLPVRNADRLTVLARQSKDGTTRASFSDAEFLALQRHLQSFSDLIAVRPGSRSFASDGSVERISVRFVSDNYFDALGVSPALGDVIRRSPTSSERREATLVLDNDFWRRRYGSDPSAVGKPVVIGGVPATVIGVAPKGFYGDSPFARADAYALLAVARAERGTAFDTEESLRILAVVAPDESVTRANAELAAAWPAIAREARRATVDEQLVAFPERFSRPNPHAARAATFGLSFLGILTVLVLGIASVDVASLVLIRTNRRMPEMALRAALGASRGRLARQLLTENAIVSALACLAGLVVGQAAGHLIGSTLPDTFAPFAIRLGLAIDSRLAIFSVLAASTVVLAISFSPVRRTANIPLYSVARTEGGVRLADAFRGRAALIAVQLAASVLLVVVSIQFLRSLTALQNAPIGFDRHGVIDFSIDPTDAGMHDIRVQRLYEDILDRARHLPEVASAALASSVPMMSSGDTASIRVPGSRETRVVPGSVGYSAVSSSYFDTLRIPILQGRGFRPDDAPEAAPVAVVSAAMAAKYWPQADLVVGRTFRMEDAPSTDVTVVGVSADVNNYSLIQSHTPYFYRPLAQHFATPVTLHVRSAGPLPPVAQRIRTELHRLAPELPVFNVKPLAAKIDGAPDGFFLLKLGVNTSVALSVAGIALSIVGVFGVVSYVAAQRTREIAVRLALGATPAQVRRGVLRDGALLVGGGVLLGTVAAVGFTKMTAGLYVGIDPFDVTPFVLAAVSVAAAALLACDIPARRAMRADPAATLRSA